jgi:hypothetical protein
MEHAMTRPAPRPARHLSLALFVLLLAGCAADDRAWRSPADKQAEREAAAATAATAASAAPKAPAVPVALQAQAAADVSRLPVRKGEGRLPFEEVVLDNGLRVVSLEDRSAPIVAVQVWYHVGSKDEQVDRQGFAHMF